MDAKIGKEWEKRWYHPWFTDKKRGKEYCMWGIIIGGEKEATCSCDGESTLLITGECERKYDK